MGTRVSEATPVEAPPADSRWRRPPSRLNSRAGFAGGATFVAGYLSLIVLIPIAALVAHGFSLGVQTGGWGAAFWHWHVHADFRSFWRMITTPAAVSAIRLSLWLSLSVAAINAVMGVAIAWVLVRDRFRAKWAIEALIDLPFALPTIVVGVVLLSLYGMASPVGINLFETWMGLMVALLFVTLPFSVRAVQPVLASLDGEAEAAAKSLGAGGVRTFVSVVLPSLWPAMLGGFGLAFARAVGEFGSISLIAGGIGRTTTASSYIFNLTQGFLWSDAAAVSTALLVLSLAVLVSSNALARRVARRLAP